MPTLAAVAGRQISFDLSKGVRQGCPRSPCLFILCTEILGAAIRQDKLICGFPISHNECK